MNEPERVVLRVEFSRSARVLEFFLGSDSESVGRWDLNKDSALNAAELERRIGYAVLAVISAQAREAVGNRNYLDDRSNRSTLILEHLRDRLKGGDESAIISIALELLSLARRTSNPKLVERAEKELQRAAAAKNSAAKKYLASAWAPEKKFALSAIEAGPKQRRSPRKRS